MRCFPGQLLFASSRRRLRQFIEPRRPRHNTDIHLRNPGAHYVVDSIADGIPCLDAIEQRMARGERP